MTTTASQPTSPPAAKARGKPIVTCQGLTRVFRDFWMRSRAKAVDNLTFDIHANEIFGLLGPNGSGKSTTIKVVLGLLRPTSGRVAVFGRLPTDVAIKKRIGYLPEESYLYPFLNARETLDYYGRLFQIDHRTRKRRTDELIEMVGLGGAQFRQVHEYSKGMQRRIGLAQALINDPDLLILDEPTTGLDPIGTRQVKDLIIELGRRGKTVLLSSHLLADVEDVVDRMIILYGGKKRREGTCSELLETRSKTTIETDDLDEETLAEIDRIIRNRTQGAILKVARPRQKLEELFLDIVEQARAERLETSGAMQGGATAEFLRAKPVQGEALLEELTREETPPTPMVEDEEKESSTPEDAGPNVLDQLTADEPDPTPQTPEPEARRPTPMDASEVDLGVIDSLTRDRSEEEPDKEGQG